MTHDTREKEEMARVTHAALHLPIAEVKNRMRTDPRAMSRQRWLIIYNALVEPRSAAEIARHCGVSKATVHAVISRYNRRGVAAIETPGKGGRRRQYLTRGAKRSDSWPRFLRKPRAGRSRRWDRSDTPSNNVSGTQLMTVPFIGFFTVMVGAN
jgi:DNA-binding MarR family transcriptional regulator